MKVDARWGGMIVVLVGCTTDTVGNGDLVDDHRLVDGFTRIFVSSSLDATVGPAAKGDVTIHGDSNLVDQVDAVVEAGELRVGLPDGLEVEATELVAAIFLPVWDRLQVTGSGEVTALEVQASGFEVEASASGPTTLGGTCVDLVLTTYGSGDIDARALTCGSVHVDLKGSSHVTVTATDAVDGTVDADAQLTVVGAPLVQDVRTYGNGSVVYE